MYVSEIPFSKLVVDTLNVNYHGTRDFTNEIAAHINDRIINVASFVTGWAFERSSDEFKQFCLDFRGLKS